MRCGTGLNIRRFLCHQRRQTTSCLYLDTLATQAMRLATVSTSTGGISVNLFQPVIVIIRRVDVRSTGAAAGGLDVVHLLCSTSTVMRRGSLKVTK
jgi:hypothetical protein